jgi:hypothetical protein
LRNFDLCICFTGFGCQHMRTRCPRVREKHLDPTQPSPKTRGGVRKDQPETRERSEVFHASPVSKEVVDKNKKIAPHRSFDSGSLRSR